MDSQSSQSRPNNMTVPHPRAPIRSTTFDHEGWIKAQQQRQRSDLQPVTEGSLVVEEGTCGALFPRSDVLTEIGSASCLPPATSTIVSK